MYFNLYGMEYIIMLYGINICEMYSSEETSEYLVEFHLLFMCPLP